MILNREVKNMKNITNAEWIKSPKLSQECEICYSKQFSAQKPVKKASLEITSLGVYVARINGSRIGDQVMTPGWTAYQKRLFVETYDVTENIKENNTISVGVAPGWKGRYFTGNERMASYFLGIRETALIAALTIEYADGTEDVIYTDKTWTTELGKNIYSDLYNGYVYDPAFVDDEPMKAVVFPHKKDVLIDRDGEKIKEQERLAVKEIIFTPKGETVLDFGQNLTGYVEFKIKGKKGEKAVISHAEVLDAEGNFYRDNLRSAKAQAAFVCDGEEHIHKAEHTFFGFRYIKLENWSDEVKAENFTAIVVHSDMKRTGHFECSSEMLNKLYSNIIWGQKGNYLDIPTDCPQRDERLGWTGDAQVFIKAAAYNYDVETFFEKWLADLRAEQRPWGTIPHVIPDLFDCDENSSAAWADAATVCPWQIYMSYGNKEIIEKSLESMKNYIEYIEESSRDGIWCKSWHFGDWLNLDASDVGKCDIGTNKDLIATAYYIYSSNILIKAMELCGEDATEQKAKREASIEAFRKVFMENGRIKPEYVTQTAATLAVHFGISDNVAETAKQLNELVTECGHLKTGFVGTPYLLHALTDNGYTETAYSLILREEYPSWLFSVRMGATTIWEHWDSLRADGTMWSTDMNSFNHYAYGAVADWMYGDMAGINVDEANPAYKHIVFRPVTDSRIDWVKASVETRCGLVASEWKTENGKTTYIFTVPEGSTATVILPGINQEIAAGEYKYIV